MANFLAAADLQSNGLLQTVMYCVGEDRNACLYRDEDASMEKLLQRFTALLPPQARPPPTPSLHMSSVWARPPTNTTELNLDVSFTSSGMAGFGLVIRDHNDMILASACSSPVEAQSAVVAEALALRWALRIA
ncbi:hypothetical protein OROGR_008983 [Orobanche gracilis]